MLRLPSSLSDAVGEKAMPETGPECPSKVRRCLPSSAFHTLTVLSPEQEAMVWTPTQRLGRVIGRGNEPPFSHWLGVMVLRASLIAVRMPDSRVATPSLTDSERDLLMALNGFPEGCSEASNLLKSEAMPFHRRVKFHPCGDPPEG